MLCDIEVQDTPTVVTDDEKAGNHNSHGRNDGEEANEKGIAMALREFWQVEVRAGEVIKQH